MSYKRVMGCYRSNGHSTIKLKRKLLFNNQCQKLIERKRSEQARDVYVLTLSSPSADMR